MIKVLSPWEDTTITYIHAHEYRVGKYMKQKLMELKVELDIL